MTRITLRKKSDIGFDRCNGQKCWYRDELDKKPSTTGHTCPFALTRGVEDLCNCCESCTKECADDAASPA